MKKMVTGALLAGAVMSTSNENTNSNNNGSNSQQTGGTGFIDCLKDTFCGKAKQQSNSDGMSTPQVTLSQINSGSDQ